MHSVHEVANLFPLMEGAELKKLAADIRENGLREAILLHPDGGIIDGRNRWRACEIAGVDPRFRTWDGKGSLVALVVSLNLHRRHLTPSQRAMAASASKRLFTAEAKERQAAGRVAGGKARQGDDSLSARLRPRSKASAQAAAAFQVSPRSVESADKVRREGVQELVDAVRKGDVSVKAAAKIVTQPKARQTEIVKMTEAERRVTIKALSKPGGLFRPDQLEWIGKNLSWQFDFEHALQAIVAMPVSPEEYAIKIRPTMVVPVAESIEAAVAWLDRFHKAWRARNAKTS